MNDFINLKKLSYEELAGVVNLYPWYGAARKEMCLRMTKMDRSKISDIIRGEVQNDYSDKDIDNILKNYLDENKDSVEIERTPGVKVAGGDFFTQSQYDMVRKDGDNVFSRFTVKTVRDAEDNGEESSLSENFCTETLAKIYEEQGYYEQAKLIYSHLLLNFPEKSAYFAALIDNLENQNIKI